MGYGRNSSGKVGRGQKIKVERRETEQIQSDATCQNTIILFPLKNLKKTDKLGLLAS